MQPILLPVVRTGERFAFSMCNPPFFESRAEAGLNPRTAHAGEPQVRVENSLLPVSETHTSCDNVCMPNFLRNDYHEVENPMRPCWRMSYL